MSDQKPDGGLAFPVQGMQLQDGRWSRDTEFGMTLRDYFASKAMQGDLANNENGALSLTTTGEQYLNLARLYYRMADAMLKARGL
ncbi:MAG: hypothetical protein PHV34_05940 [Verrucomicrobiae bacterium]|nr:hypothetical protein [Verrucomicrobiae bacterium]